jgi:sec-independent protein translocase protein TatA
MFPRLGPAELIIILIIVIVLFGVGRISKIAGELGSGIRSFKEGLQGDEKEKDKENKEKGEANSEDKSPSS